MRTLAALFQRVARWLGRAIGMMDRMTADVLESKAPLP